ncbi:MAG: glycosyltransferase family 4 protein [Pseudomonadota bacterium]|nr:glycosyl transferase [Gammaproteobacteria bacterium]MEC8010982.1 glycosyltransferase family 4 protein [Pseudomonadota bacterium]HBF07667.1 glycosyl transferase [Gammaproteobacteria bacterium]|tara:strand:- start:1348 stop:2415 length:1068 start_codon:yes stop_codon:yes gene_type:complete
MKIAQVAPLHESVPPKTYGGTERVVHYLTEELVKAGHDVTLFAAGDSQTSAKLHPIIPESLRKSKQGRDAIASHILSFSTLLEQLADFDIVHFHTEFYQFMVGHTLCIPHISTLHCRLDTADYAAMFAQHPNMPVVSISNSQRNPVEKANWVDTVYNGIPAENYDFKPKGKQDYLAFIGRISPLKNPVEAIQIAIEANVPIKIAAKVDPWDEEYFETQFKPYLSHPLVEFIGEVNEQEKNELLGNALGLLFPIAWPEPFGLVMIEAMACGTPVIAYRNGAVPEVMKHHFTGYIVDSVSEAVEAVHNLHSISREYCRDYFVRRFSAEAMAKNYISLYERQIFKARSLFNPALEAVV